MEANKPGNKNLLRKGFEAAVLAAGFGLPVENPAEAQGRTRTHSESNHESRAEGLQESEGTIEKFSILEKDHEIPNQRYPGNHRELRLKIALDSEGIIDLSGLDVSTKFDLPIEEGDRVVVKYKIRENDLKPVLYELHTKSKGGDVITWQEFLYNKY